MSMDKSLKARGQLQRARSVLTRAERITRLQAEDRWHEGMSPFGLPKVKVVRAVIRKAKKAPKEEEAAAEGGEETASTEEKS